MSETVSEGKQIPQSLVEAVGHDPLSFLVPKDGLSDLVDPSITPNVRHEEEVFATEVKEKCQELKAVAFRFADDSNQALIFKRPASVSVAPEAPDDKVDLYYGLSPLAKMCLDASECQVSSDDIRCLEPIKLSKPGKHKQSVLERSREVISSESETPTKKPKVGSGVAITRVDLGDKYLQEFAAVYETITEGHASNSARAAECWQKMTDEFFVLTEVYLARLEIILRNIVSIPSTWEKVETQQLIEILKVLVGNIKCAKQFREDGFGSSSLDKIAHASIALIFTIFKISKNDSKLSLEEFVMEPLEFLGSSLESIKDDSNENLPEKESVLSLQHSISHLPAYIEGASFLDESPAFKIVTLFAGLIGSRLNTGNDVQLQNCWENITDSSTRILVTLFKKFPPQREFIVEELLSHIENMPSKRNQKNLRRIENGIFVTDFTMTIVRMFEILNCYETSNIVIDDSIDKSDVLSLVSEKYHQDAQLLDTFGNRVIDTIWTKFHQSFSKYRHVLENYFSDLVTLLPYPQYAISETLLTQSFKKLLIELTATQQQPANVETISLQVLGTVGAAIFDIKCATRPNEGNNIIKLVNYPEYLPQFMNSYENCLKFCLSKLNRQRNVAYIWNKTIGALLKGIDYTKEDKIQNKKMAELVMSEVQKSESLSKNSTIAPRIDYSDIKCDYFSYLHAFELINLYEPYMKLLLSLLESEKIKIKSTAIKCLSLLASRDNTILSSPMVKVTIGKTLGNSPASVKDAILDLISIGSCAIDYFRQLNASFDDESILVRKHVLKMNEKIYSETTSLNIRAFVASRILLRLEDEEDAIIETARSVLMKQWIFSIIEEQSAERQRTICDNVVKTMAGVINISDKCSRHFVWFLNFYLLNEETLSTKTAAEVKQCLNKLTDILVQKITEMQSSPDDTEVGFDRGALLGLLAKFADCNVSFITKNHIVALYPYLISDEKNELQFYILHVFKSTLDKATAFKPKFLLELETTLLSRLPRMNVKEIGEAMPLLWRVATQRGDAGRIVKACSSCFQHLSPYISQVNKNPNINPEGKLQRLIYLATGFARYCHFTKLTGKPPFIKADESVYAHVAKRLLLLSAEGVPHLIRRVSIKNLTQLCGSHPKLFNSRPILTLLDEELNGNSPDIKYVILESLYEFFKAEERESIMKAGVNCSMSSNERLKKKMLKEKKIESISDGVCSALVTRFLKPILAACCSTDLKSSFIAVRLIKLTLQYGYTNPSHCIPTVIGLIASTNEYMSLLATEILRELLEKHETMVFSGFVQGFKVAVEFSELALGADYYKNDQFLIRLQKVAGVGKKNSSRFFKSTFKLLQVYFGQAETAQLDTYIANSIVFLSVNLSQLTFPTQSELFDVLKSIETAADHLNEQLEDQLHELEGPEVSPGIKETLLILLCLKKLNAYLMTEYGLTMDILAAGNASVPEVKKKNGKVASKQAFVGELDKIFLNFTRPVSLADIDKIMTFSDA